MKKNKKIGIIILVLPLAVIVLALLGSFAAGFFDVDRDMFSAIAAILGIGGLVLFALTFPIGIFFLNRKKYNIDVYKDLQEDQKKFITGWSWSACFTVWLWAAANKMWVEMVLGWVPFVNTYIWAKLSFDGRKYAWEKQKKMGFEKFRSRQKRIAWIVITIAILSNLLWLAAEAL